MVVISETEETIPLSMTSGQTYLYRSASDDGGSSANRATSLSGTTICSNAPIALFMGGQSAKIPSDPENHIFSQAYPTDKWEKHSMLHQHMEWSMIMCSLLRVKTIPKYAEMVM